MARGRSFEAKISSAARVSTPRAFRMFRERLRELHARIGGLRVPFRLRGAAEALFLLLVGHQRGVSRLRRVVVLRIEVRRALVFGGGIAELLALEQRLGEQVVGAGRNPDRPGTTSR